MGTAKLARGQLEQNIRRRLLQAIFEQRLPPGARLTEEMLASTFDVSRTIIRQVIARLSQDGILVKQSSGATSVAAPTKDEARQILTVRRMIEPDIVKSLAKTLRGQALDELYNHLDREDAARKTGDRATLVRLVGEFHLHIAELTGNVILSRLMMELQALVCLAILLYATAEEACPAEEHRRIAGAIAAGDGELAAELMRHHLDHIEQDLNLTDEKPDLRIAEALDWLSGRAGAR